MAVPFTCANGDCGKRFRVNDDLAGKQIQCPACRTVQAVPAQGLRKLAPLPHARGPVEEPPRRAEQD